MLADFETTSHRLSGGNFEAARLPEDWNGGLPQFKTDAAKDGYSVPTLISADGVHPSNPSKFQDYSEESLNENGYQLRTVLTLNAYADVIRLVLAPPKK